MSIKIAIEVPKIIVFSFFVVKKRLVEIKRREERQRERKLKEIKIKIYILHMLWIFYHLRITAYQFHLDWLLDRMAEKKKNVKKERK